MKNKLANKDRIVILPSQEELLRLLSYSPATGVLLWKPRPRADFQTNKSHAVWNARYANKPALNTLHKHGYLCGRLLWAPVRAHRVIWKLMTGEDAEVVDHDDGNRANNVWTNLKSGSDADNLKNKKLYSSNKSGHIGIYWNKDGNKWHAQIRDNGVRRHLGFFSSLDDAIAARAAAEANLGFNVNHGRKVS